MLYTQPPATNINPDDAPYMAGFTKGFDFDGAARGTLDIEGLPIVVDVAEIDQYPNEIYAMIRKNGLGTSDSSAVLGVNPYTSRSELIEEKCRDYSTAEEKAIGDKDAVRKGRDLEPLIVAKHEQIIKKKIIKPVHMYAHKEYPHIKFNFDGVIDKTMMPDGTFQYIPDEIKVVTMFGKKHYNFQKAYFVEGLGFKTEVPEPPNFSFVNSIQDKAAAIGIPPYYYTQLQQQILGLNAPFGYLTIMLETDWRVYSYLVWRDEKVISNLILEGYKVWNTILKNRKPSFNLGLDGIVG
jgi:hypothetical protein